MEGGRRGRDLVALDDLPRGHFPRHRRVVVTARQQVAPARVEAQREDGLRVPDQRLPQPALLGEKPRHPVHAPCAPGAAPTHASRRREVVVVVVVVVMMVVMMVVEMEKERKKKEKRRGCGCERLGGWLSGWVGG